MAGKMKGSEGTGAKIISLGERRETPFRARSPSPEISRISAMQVISEIQGILAEWAEDVQQALRIPRDGLFKRRDQDGATLYSSDDQFTITSVINLFSGALEVPSKLPDYGFAIYETPGSTYFVLFDSERNICIRQKIMRTLVNPANATWADVARTITYAEKQASTSGQTALVDKESF